MVYYGRKYTALFSIWGIFWGLFMSLRYKNWSKEQDESPAMNFSGRDDVPVEIRDIPIDRSLRPDKGDIPAFQTQVQMAYGPRRRR